MTGSKESFKERNHAFSLFTRSFFIFVGEINLPASVKSENRVGKIEKAKMKIACATNQATLKIPEVIVRVRKDRYEG